MKKPQFVNMRTITANGEKWISIADFQVWVKVCAANKRSGVYMRNSLRNPKLLGRLFK